MSEEKASGKTLLGRLLVERGLLTPEQVERALRLQVGGNRRLGHLLIKMGFISDEDLLRALSEQLALPIISIAEEFSPAAAKTLPRYLCRKYSVVPLSLEQDRVLRLAMVDPLDAGAVADVEHYTGLVVAPVLARQRDVDRSIGRLVPRTLRDIFNPQVFGEAARVLAAACLALLLLAGYLVWAQVRRERFGTAVEAAGLTSYRNLDLVVERGRDGSIRFMGRGAFAPGYYGVTFADAEHFVTFVSTQERQLSQRQREWLQWIIAGKLKPR